MSCDFAVWFPDEASISKKANIIYNELCEGKIELSAHSSIDDFYNELISIHPEIDDLPDEEIGNIDLCPWSIAIDKSSSHLIMCCVWEKADYVEKLIHNLANKYSLAVYNPQNNVLVIPNKKIL